MSRQFVNTLEANIYASLGAVANVTIDSVTAGSIVVSDTIAFTGSDAEAASKARDTLVTTLSSADGVGTIFGTSFGDVAVSSIQTADVPNPSKFNVYLAEVKLMYLSNYP